MLSYVVLFRLLFIYDEARSSLSRAQTRVYTTHVYIICREYFLKVSPYGYPSQLLAQGFTGMSSISENGCASGCPARGKCSLSSGSSAFTSWVSVFGRRNDRSSLRQEYCKLLSIAVVLAGTAVSCSTRVETSWLAVVVPSLDSMRRLEGRGSLLWASDFRRPSLRAAARWRKSLRECSC